MSKDESKTSAEEETKDSESSSSDSSSTSSDERPGLVRTIASIDNAIGNVEHAFVLLALFALIGVGTYQFLASRLFGINDTWPFEAVRLLVFYCAMGGAALSAQKGRMISMDFVARKLPAKSRTILRMSVSLFVVLACVLLLKGGLSIREAVASIGEHGEVLAPGTIVLALPVGAVLIALHYVLHAVSDGAYLLAGQVPPEEEGPQAH